MRNAFSVGLYTLCLIGVGACSKAPSEAAVDSVNAVGKAVMEPLFPKDASRQTNKLIAQLDSRAECDGYRTQLLEAGKGSPTSGKTQTAIIQTMKAAREAGCAPAR